MEEQRPHVVTAITGSRDFGGEQVIGATVVVLDCGSSAARSLAPGGATGA
jgi:hypothetical protein